MKVSIDENVCEKHGISISELLVILLVKTGVHIPQLINQMESSQKIVRDDSNGYLVTQRWDNIVCNVLLDSDDESQPEEAVEGLAEKLMKIFPQGKKEGTSQYWRGNKREITLRLKKFFKLYGNHYEYEDILTAAQKYIESFNGRYTYMRVLKYFIWKDEKRVSEDGVLKVIEVSELANYLENAGQEDDLKEDWTSNIN